MVIINNNGITLNEDRKFTPIGIVGNKNIPNNYLINEDGYILDTITNELVDYYQNEYGRIYVLLGKEKLSVPLIVATKFLPNPGNYRYATRKDQSILDFSINNVTWVKYPTTIFNKDLLISRSKDKFGDQFTFDKVDNHLSGRDNTIVVTCKKHGDFSINIDTFFRSKHGGCKQCIREAIDLGIKSQLQLLKEENNLKSINDLRITFPDIYNRLKKNPTSIYELFYDRNFQDTEDFQDFINEYNIQNSSEFRKTYPGLFDRASSLGLLKTLTYPSALYKLRGLDKMSVDEIKTILINNNIKTTTEFKNFDPSLYSISGRRGILSLLGLKKTKSLMELLVSDKLKSLGYIIEEQKTFPWLVNKSKMFLDIYIPDKNLAIELHGSIHYIFNDFYKDEEQFKQTEFRDNLKNRLCKENNITVIYYTDKRTKYFENIPKEFIKNYRLGKVFTEMNDLINFIKDF